MDPGAGRAVVYITEETFVEGLAGLRWQLRNVIQAGGRVIVADVGELRQLSSSAVAALLSTHRVCRTRGGGVVIRHPNRRILDLLKRTGLHHVFEIETTRTDQRTDHRTELRNTG